MPSRNWGQILDVAPLYAAAGRIDEAIDAAEWGIDDRAYRCGPDDPLTVAARTLLAELQAARRTGEAV